MKDEERLERRNLRARMQGDGDVPIKRKWRRLEKRIKRLRRQYQNGDRSLDEYWNAMAYVVKNYQQITQSAPHLPLTVVHTVHVPLRYFTFIE